MAEFTPTWELWQHIRDSVLSTPRMEDLLRGPGRVYVSHDPMPDREGAEGEVWARVVVVPTQTTWGSEHNPTGTQRVGFLVRAECPHLPGVAGFSAPRLLSAVQEEAHARLQGLVPSGLSRLMVAAPIHARTQPHPSPLVDSQRELLYISAEYGVEVAPTNGQV